MATQSQETIASLFVAYFNRAPANNGFDKWVADLETGVKTYEQISAGFIEAPEFTDTYGEVDVTSDASLTTFVTKVYKNVLGREGSQAGIANQVNAIKAGGAYDGSLADFMAGFTASAKKTFDPTDAKWDYLTADQKTQATVSNHKMLNKIAVAVDYSEKLGDATNITGTTQTNAAAAQLAASKILSEVTDDIQTVTDSLKGLDILKTKPDPISILNAANSSLFYDISIEISSNTIETLEQISTSSTYGVSALDSNIHWEDSLDTITYNFNTTIPEDYKIYANNSLTAGWESLNTKQQNTVDDIMQKTNQLLGITLEKVSQDGMISLNMVDMEPNTAGFSFMPGTHWQNEGDIFLNTDFNTEPNYGLEIGEFGYRTIVHELGHALGLKHPFEGEEQLPTSLNDVNHSIMSYTNTNSYIPVLSFSSSKIFIDYTQLQPSFYSIYDVAALQSIYGANTTTNQEDTTYTITPTLNPKVSNLTIWDAGGTDTIDLSNTTGFSNIDLNDGTINSADQHTLEDIISYHQDIAIQNDKAQHIAWIADNITDLYQSNNLFTGKNNLSIATGVIIENITTGSDDDTIIDNEVNNTINTGAGDDNIYLGNGGYDTIDGGDGIDTLYLKLPKEDITIRAYQDRYFLQADNFSADLLNIEQIHLNDDISYSIYMLI